MWMEIITCKGPYHFDSVLDRLSLDPIIHINKDEQLVRVPSVIEGKSYVLNVRAIGTVKEPAFELCGTDKTIKEEAIRRIRRIFQFDFSLNEVMSHFHQTNLSRIFQQHEGTPIVLEFDFYSCLMKCIIHQQLNVAFAHTLTSRFVKEFGYQIEGVWFYPTPETVAGLEYDDLRALQFSGRKAEYVIDTSRLIADGKLDLMELDLLPEEELMKDLVKIRGIGPWTVQNFMLSGLGRPNLFPKADIGIQKAIQKHFNLEKKPTSDEMDEYSKEWSPYLSYATLYLWRSIE
ncbi:DNA-3-methyladenine glycosylase family protein [Metabacillus litoralis]|uniref:DNA-3-methyladenine glycosylase family protein n=1 Tax=Metabacillus litoralis TaxID=152268 RepID=UPI000EF5C66C|nr:DNA-3-methyladenine glycosylase [Metabacillus litoralis]